MQDVFEEEKREEVILKEKNRRERRRFRRRGKRGRKIRKRRMPRQILCHLNWVEPNVDGGK